MKAYRKNGNMIIEISEDAMCDGAHCLPEINATVTDREKFLNFCVNHVCEFGDNGDFNSASRMTRLLDDLVVEAIENDAGVNV